MDEAHTALPALKQAYAHWNETKGADTSKWHALLADEVDFRSLADGAEPLTWTKPGRTRAEVEAYLTGLAETVAMDFYEVDRYVAEGDTVVAIGRSKWRNRKNGNVFASPLVTIWKFKNGKAVAFHEFYDTLGAAKSAG